MNEAQWVRNLMAEAGVEYTIYETEELIWVAKELNKLAKLPIKTLKAMVDPDDIKSIRLYETLVKIKKANKKAKDEAKRNS